MSIDAVGSFKAGMPLVQRNPGALIGGFVVMMVPIGGGLTSFWGPLIGAAFFILARDLLGAYTETWLFCYGLLFMAIVLWKPEGLAGIGRDVIAMLRKRASS